MKKAIGYIRVSTEQQADEGVSLSAQRAKITAWCELNEYELVAIYEDAGISGKTIEKRPKLQAALAEMKKDMADMNQKMANCMKTEKSKEECHKEAMKDCHVSKATGKCAMMDGMNMDKGNMSHGKMKGK